MNLRLNEMGTMLLEVGKSLDPSNIGSVLSRLICLCGASECHVQSLFVQPFLLALILLGLLISSLISGLGKLVN